MQILKSESVTKQATDENRPRTRNGIIIGGNSKQLSTRRARERLLGIQFVASNVRSAKGTVDRTRHYSEPIPRLVLLGHCILRASIMFNLAPIALGSDAAGVFPSLTK